MDKVSIEHWIETEDKRTVIREEVVTELSIYDKIDLLCEALPDYIKNKKFDLELWWNVQRFFFHGRIWDLRGLPRCCEHGTHAQSIINGNCQECLDGVKFQTNDCDYCEGYRHCDEKRKVKSERMEGLIKDFPDDGWW